MKPIHSVPLVILVWVAAWYLLILAYLHRQVVIDWIRIPGPCQIVTLTSIIIGLVWAGIWIYRKKYENNDKRKERTHQA